jgi:dihydroorotase
MGPNDKFDLVIKGGEVLDPSQKLRARRDIGIRNGVVEALEADIPAERALRVLDAGGKLVTPRPHRLHAHVYPYGSAIGIPADELVPFQATADGGLGRRRGREQLRGVPPPSWRRHARACTRSCTSPTSASPGSGAGALQHQLRRRPDRGESAAENADVVLGIKVRMSENVIDKHGLEPLKRAIAACEMAARRERSCATSAACKPARSCRRS